MKQTESSERRRKQGRTPALPIIIIISLLSLLSACGLGSMLGRWEAGSADLRMRLRYHLSRKMGISYVRNEITLLAIDTKTSTKFGMLQRGQWLSRKPYTDQLTFAERSFHPSVMAYDVIFQDPMGEDAYRRGHVSSSSDKLTQLQIALEKLSLDQALMLSSEELNDMTQLSVEQGNIFLANRLASIAEKGAFPVVLGYNFRGGWLDQKLVKVPWWTDADVFGNDPGGDEEMGDRIPYLKDARIPEEDVHGQHEDGWPHNANTPGKDLIGYSKLGFLNVRPDDDSVYRKVPLVMGFEYFNKPLRKHMRVFVPAFSLMSCLYHLGMDFPLEPGEIEVRFGKEIIIRPPSGSEYCIPIDEHGRMYVNFNVQFNDFRAISFCDVAPDRRLRAQPEMRAVARQLRPYIDDKLVFVGHVATALDTGSCPLSAEVVPLVYVHMMTANSILNRSFIVPLGASGDQVLLICLAVLFTTICVMVKTARLIPTSLLLTIFYLLGAYSGIHYNWVILPTIAPLFYLALCSFGVISYRYLTESRARRQIRGMFSTMVSEKVLEYLEENPHSFSLQGHNVEATILFSDIADFTGISENLPPERLTQLLNSYLTPVTNSIMEQGGYVDKYVGDEVMAVWGAPFPDPMHALSACNSALVNRETVRSFNDHWHRDYGFRIRVRTGINSGTVTAGNMGSEKKFQYTMIGDAVNLAKRFEPANKIYGTEIILGSETYRMVREQMVCRPLGKIRAKGKTGIVLIYELAGRVGEVSDRDLELHSLFGEALESFYGREWNLCIEYLKKIEAIADDYPARHLQALALEYRDNPPAPSWQGEVDQKDKG